MQNLPPIETALGLSVLPMADNSAQAIQCALLAEDGSIATEIFTTTLAADPPLTVWAFCRVGKRCAGGLASIADLATWLAEHALDVFDWPEDSADLSLPADVVRALVIESAAVGELAAQRKGTANAATRLKAGLRGLVHAAPRWLLLGAGVGMDSASPPALPWFDTLANQRGPVAEAVREAHAEWATIAAPNDLFAETDARRSAAELLADRWHAAGGPSAGCLPALVLRLRRLKRLEAEFAPALETEKIEAMAEFAAGAGHEINNPLTVIAGRAQLLLREETDRERRKELALINAQAMRVFEMIADMRLFARPPNPELARCDLTQVLVRVVDELAEEAARREIELACAGSAEPIPILADAAQITVALRAMGQNALEAVGLSGRVEFVVQCDESQVRIRIADDGPGLEPQQRRHIFDAYYSARQAGRGLGLGLCKAWVIARGHGGCIEVAGEAGHGAVFTLVLPRRRFSDV